MWMALVCALTFAQYKEQAEKAMNLSFSMDEVENRLAAPAPAQAAARMAQMDGNAEFRTMVVAQPALPLVANSRITDVVVYRDRAVVVRQRTVDVGDGVTRVEFTGLPLAVAPESIQAEATAGAIVSVELVSGTEVEETARIEETRGDLRELTDDLGEIRDRIESLIAQRMYLQTTLLTGGHTGPTPPLDQVRGALAFLGDAERQIASQLRIEQDKAETLDEKIRPLLLQLDDPFATGRTVRVEVRSDRGQKSTVDLRYQVWGASWSPAYNARYDEKTSKITLEYYGVVAQGTGEGWKDARLAFSTANPAISGDLPILSTWWLGSGAGNLMADIEQTKLDNRGSQGIFGPAPGGVEGVIATSRSGGAVVFPVDGLRTIAGDGSPQRIEIGEQTFPALVELSAVPKLVAEVYRRARLKYEGSAPLLPGPVTTFAGTEFVGSGRFTSVVPGEELKLAVGTDDRFKIERKLTARNVENTGAKRNVRYTFSYRIDVANFSPDAREILVTDQIPVSSREKVVVELLPETTAALAALPEDPPGLLRWKLALAPNEKESIVLSYSVTFPREEEGYVQQELDMAY